MTAGELDEAMRYGSRRDVRGRGSRGVRPRSEDRLAEPVPLPDGGDADHTRGGRWSIRRWDLDRVAAHDQWRSSGSRSARAPPELVEPLRGRSGTVVLWQRLDRVSGYARPDGAAAGNALEALAAEVERAPGDGVPPLPARAGAARCR